MSSTAGSPSPLRIINCHTHTFTHAHTPDRFLPWPVPQLVRFGWFRQLFFQVARVIDPERKTCVGRYAEIVHTSYAKTQDGVFTIVRDFYPRDTRFVVLPMDMTHMNAGRVKSPIAEQHRQLASLRGSQIGTGIVIPFAAVDPRHKNIVSTTKSLLEDERFCGIKLYPPTGYHPYDDRLHDLYDYADEHKIPALTHCSRPASVQYRGTPTGSMLKDPENGNRPLTYNRFDLLTYFTRPDAYLPILRRWPNMPLCLAHFGGGGDWNSYINEPWQLNTSVLGSNWLGRILELIRSREFPNLWTDISYTLFANDDFVYLLKVLLGDQTVLSRVLFGSDFYVVENASLEERRRSLRVRAILGDNVYQTIAETNPRLYLGDRCASS